MEDGYKQTVAGLLRKHQELLGDIGEASAALLAKQSALDAIEAALRVFDPAIKPATEHKRRGTGVDGLHRFLLDLIRSQGSVTTLGAATALIADRGLDERDKALLTNLRKRCGDGLQKMKRQGRVTGERYGNGGELEWRLAGQ
jgi:hypothetical protein